MTVSDEELEEGIHAAEQRRSNTGLPDFRDFFESQYGRLLKTLYLVTGSRFEAEDLAQEAMARVYERWNHIGNMASPQGYAFKVAFNLHRKSYRRAMRTSGEEVDRSVPGGETELVRRLRVEEALATLPRSERQAVVLVDWLGMAPEEASTVLGVKHVTLGARLHRGRAKLRELLEVDDG
jgi:RNA polymerase sigma factor (sigma-70 family)